MKNIIFYFYAFVLLGLINASFGPALPYLAQNTGTALSVISYLFAVHRLGYMTGSFVGGKLYDRVPGHTIIAAMLVITLGALLLVPVAKTIWLLLPVVFLAGLMGGAVDVGGNVLLVWASTRRLGTLMSALHLFYGLGAFLSPLVLVQAVALTGEITWGYRLLAILVLPCAVLIARLPSPQRPGSRGTASRIQPSPWLPIMITVFLFLCVASEGSFGGWIYTYALRTQLADKISAGHLTSIYWGCYTLGRVASALLAMRLEPRAMLAACAAGNMAGVILLLLWPTQPGILWAGTMVFGFCMGPVFPAAITLASRKIPLTGSVTGMFMVGASLGNMFLPWLIGQFFERLGPVVVPVAILAAMALASALLPFILRAESPATFAGAAADQP